MKKVLFFIESLSRGGAEKVLSDVVCHLDKTKFDVTVCTVTDGDVYQEKVSEACRYRSLLKTESYRAGGIRKVLFWLMMKLIYHFPARLVYRLFFHEEYDVEVAFVEGFATKLIAVSSNKKSRKIAWIHTDMENNPYADRCYRNCKAQEKAYRCFDEIVCVSQRVKEVFEKRFPACKPAVVQYNPVDEMLIAEKSAEPIDFQRPGGLLLASVGRLEEQKGYVRLLNAVGKLLGRGYRFSLWIIGDGTQRKALEDIIRKYDMADSVQLLGFQPNPFCYLEKCDAFVCSSYAEGFSTAATESLILEKPIFTVDCAGMNELFGGYSCGEIVDNSYEALYDMLERLVSGKTDLNLYRPQVSKRAKCFKMQDRMQEIEKLLSGGNGQ